VTISKGKTATKSSAFSPGDSSPDDPSAATRPSRRARALVIAGSLVVVLIAVGVAVLGGFIPGAPLLSGPLEGSDGVDMKSPMQPGDTGMLWGVLELQNRSGSTIVLDSVEVVRNPNHVKLLRDPYIWDDARVGLLKVGSVSGYTLPLPAKWKIPPKREVRGFRIRPDSGGKSDQSGDEESEYNGASPEVLFEFAKPARASEISGIRVRYHIGWYAYQRTFDGLSFTMCPATDPTPCGWDKDGRRVPIPTHR